MDSLLPGAGQLDSPDCVRLSGWPAEFLLQSGGSLILRTVCD